MAPRKRRSFTRLTNGFGKHHYDRAGNDYGDRISDPRLAGLRQGFFLGYDREHKDNPITYQAYMIICLTTCLLAMMGQEIYANFKYAEETMTIDLGKVISGTLTGIGFLGAGAIMKRNDDQLIGTATGASIWAAGGLGLMLGHGLYILVFASFFLIWFILALLPKFMHKR
jgi:putative Mg2+ transporter-C (MgtC) family protein